MVNRVNTRSKELGSLSDSVLMEVIALAKREALRRGITPEKPLDLLQILANLTGGDKRLGIARTLLTAIIFPSVHNRLEQVVLQTLQEGMDLADYANTLLKKTKKSIETIVEEDIFRV